MHKTFARVNVLCTLADANKQRDMKNTIKQLTELLNSDIDADDFYVITTYIGQIKFQGYYSAARLNKYSEQGFEFNLDGGYMIAEKGEIQIILT